jgi:hypothetical protein
VGSDRFTVESGAGKLSFLKSDVEEWYIGGESQRLYAVLGIKPPAGVIITLARRPRSRLLSIWKSDASTSRTIGLPLISKKLAIYVSDVQGLANELSARK